MRPFRFLPKPLRVLLIANAIVFGLAFVLGKLLGLHISIPGVGYLNVSNCISYVGAFWPFAPQQIWRFVTYMFVHVDFWHFLFNMLMLWMFGSDVADMMGSKHFTGMYFFCGIFAAIFSLAMGVLGLSNYPIIGASGALMGIFVAYYRFFPDRMLLMFFFFPMRIKYAMWFMVAVDVFMAPSGDGVAHLAHLGGVVAGFIYMFLYEKGFGNTIRNARRSMGDFASRRRFKMQDGGRKADADAATDDQPLEGEVFYMDEQKRMDEILKKVSREGINSLTDSERRFLLQAGERLRRRRGGL